MPASMVRFVISRVRIARFRCGRSGRRWIVDDDLSRHANQPGRPVRLTVILVYAWRVEELREGRAWIDAARVECTIVSRHGMRQRAAIGPKHSCARCDVNFCGCEAD